MHLRKVERMEGQGAGGMGGILFFEARSSYPPSHVPTAQDPQE